ncbi:YhzD family protein [Thermoflavimicrobium daqui]|uniref:YhzD-like protein n=1 Tax=Thermoflavimicrobium daqui TaxID=2137476 RepID=A0A364K9J0_9BACL|nr:YhzD family protein [Thermoflavimicrobium daqui]RAL26953.1 hypothetical protein DL897_02605 [Thermoflavimicrobium daqui]
MYHMTVFDLDGKVLYDEVLHANTDQEAKKVGYAWLSEHNHEDKPHRIFHTTGRLVSFKPHSFQLHQAKSS